MERKKVGILTFPNSPSFGASLQMHGMYRALDRMGADPEVINYINDYMASKTHIHGKQGMPLWKKLLLGLHDGPGKRKFRKFENRIAKYPANPVSRGEDLRPLADRYDKMVCGSDQVWNPHITGNDLSYFFDFCQQDSKKVAYAPSFGITQIPQECREAYSRELSRFYALSAREERGCEMVTELTGRACPQVLDPSMLVEQSYWKTLEKKPRHLPARYIVSFIFNPRPEVSEFIARLSREKGLPVVTLGGGLFTRLKDRSSTGPIGPDGWLYAINHADHVVTDSFHGAAFSLIFERPLYLSLASSTNSRLVTLARTFEITHRVIGGEGFDPERPIDYVRAGDIMAQKREESLEYLKNSLLE